MDFSFSIEQTQLRDSARRFIERESSLKATRGNPDLGSQRGLAYWQTFADLGWLELAVGKNVRSFPSDQIELMILAEELGRGLLAQPFMTSVLAGQVMASSVGDGSPILRDIATGVSRCTFALHGSKTYSHAHDAPVRATHTENEGYLLTGRKLYVPDLDGSEFCLVSASLETTASSCEPAIFVVDTSAAGIRRRCFPTIDGNDAGTLDLVNMRVEANALLSRGEDALALVQQYQTACIILSAAEALGIMEELLHLTLEHCKLREQFGQSISRFQVIQHRLANSYIACESVRSLLYAAAIKNTEGSPDTLQSVAALKVKVGELGRSVAEDSVQLHGAIGFTDDCVVGLYYKRLVAIDALFGNADVHLQSYIDSMLRKVQTS